GDQDEARDAADPLVRFYWNLTAAAAVEYVALVTGRFNHEGVPFRTKVMADPSSYVRADGGVLYLERRHFPAARRLILEIHEAIEGRLRPGVPMFTKRLAAGLGMAEDPGSQMSFGQSRCRIAARSLCLSAARGLSRLEERLDALAAAFRAEGLDPGAPFLERGSVDFYTLSDELPAAARFTRPARPARRPKRRWKNHAKGHNQSGV
ncbi:MAG: T3SS effector HopA1 family protein, partial [Pyrinomonadaceae bacterium]